MQQNRVERILKGNLKGLLKVTQSFLVAFLITGAVLQAAPQKEEKEVLLFMSGMIQDGGGSGSHRKTKTNFIEVPDVFNPIEPGPVIIWENGSDIQGDEYILSKSLDSMVDGLKTTTGTIVNQGAINTKRGYAGINVIEAGLGINSGEIKGIGVGMIALNQGEVINNQDIYAVEVGIKAVEGSKAVNEGEVYLDFLQNNIETTGMIASDPLSSIVNKGDITINIHGRGMEANNGAIAINEGNIWRATSAEVIGMQGKGIDSLVVNKGVIEALKVPMNVSQQAKAINEGLIIHISDNSGMMAASGATAINNGEIRVVTSYGTGIGMYASGEGSIVRNKGEINVNTFNAIGMKAVNGGKAINEGIINLGFDNNIGIYVDSTSSYENTGTINIAAGTTGNQKIIAEAGAKIVNSGSIVAEGEFDTGEGEFIMSSGGTLESDSIKGDIRTSGALARGGFEDTYSTYKMLKTNNLEGDVISNSAMFNAQVTENADENGYYDVELIRKDFNSLMANGEIGELLEENYKDTDNELKEDYYDALKLLSTNKELNQATNDTFGIGYFEGLAKQSLDTVKTTRNVIKNNIFTEAGNRTVGDVIAIGGMDASTIELDSSGNFIGYDYDLYSIYFGVDKQIASEWRIGAVGTVGKGEADYDNANDKSDDIYQGTFYALYESDFKVNTMLYLGQIDSDLERNVNFADWNKKYEDNVDTKFIGLDTAISKRYNLNNFYIEPKAELNTTYFKQEGVHEQGEGGVSIDSQEYYSIETGIGGAIGRSFLQEKLAIEGSMMFYTELGDPYKDQESKVNDLFEGDKVKINSYQGNDYYADLGLDVSYKVTEPLKINLGGSYITGEKEDNWNINLGLRYVM